MSGRGEGDLPSAAGLVARMALRSPLKLGALLVANVVVAFVMVGALLLSGASERALSVGLGRLGADLMIVPAGAEVPLQRGLIGGVPVALRLPEGVAEAVATVPGVARVAPQHFLTTAVASCCEAGNLFLVGFDPERDFTLLPWVAERLERPTERPPIWVGGAVANGPGGKLRLYNTVFEVAGRLDRAGVGYFDNAVFIPYEGVRVMAERSRADDTVTLEIAWEAPSLVLVALAEGADPVATAHAVRQAAPGAEVLEAGALVERTRARMAGVLELLPLLSVMAWLLVAGLGVAAQLLYWSQRRPTLGLLVACGAGPGRVKRLFLGEAVALGGLGAFVGVALAVLALSLFQAHLQVALGVPVLLDAASLDGPALAGAVALFLATAAAPAWLVLRRALAEEPYALIRGGR